MTGSSHGPAVVARLVVGVVEASVAAHELEAAAVADSSDVAAQIVLERIHDADVT